MQNWKRDLLVIPLIVGVVVALATYFLPKIFEKGKELSYSVEGPTAYIPPIARATIKVTINGISAEHLFGYKVRVRNSGSASIKNVPVQISFGSSSDPFEIFNVTHETEPKQEFGNIQETPADVKTRRFVYELLNPGDQDVLTFLTNAEAPLNVYAKAEDLKLVRVESETKEGWFDRWKWIAQLTTIVIATLASLVSVGLKTFAERRAR